MKYCSSELQFCKFDEITLLYEKTGAIILVQPGLMAGWQLGKQNTDKFRDFKN